MQNKSDVSRRTVCQAGTSLCLATLSGIAIQPVSGDEEDDETETGGAASFVEPEHGDEFSQQGTVPFTVELDNATTVTITFGVADVHNHELNIVATDTNESGKVQFSLDLSRPHADDFGVSANEGTDVEAFEGRAYLPEEHEYLATLSYTTDLTVGDEPTYEEGTVLHDRISVSVVESPAGDDENGDGETGPEPDVQFLDQESDGTSLTVATAATDVEAFVVIEGDEYGDVIADPSTRLNLEAGETVEDVELEPDDGPLSAGTYELTAQLQAAGGDILASDDATVTVDDAQDDDGERDGTEDDDETGGADDGGTDAAEDDPDDPGDDEAGTPDDADDDGPGFGVTGALTGIGGAAYMLWRRFDGSDVED